LLHLATWKPLGAKVDDRMGKKLASQDSQYSKHSHPIPVATSFSLFILSAYGM
jgi:hypothetical protein